MLQSGVSLSLNSVYRPQGGTSQGNGWGRPESGVHRAVWLVETQTEFLLLQETSGSVQVLPSKGWIRPTMLQGIISLVSSQVVVDVNRSTKCLLSNI